MTPQEIIDVVTAFSQGKAIECKAKHRDDTWCLMNRPAWNFDAFDYRVKPEPREFWVNEYGPGDYQAHETEKKANSHALSNRIRCIRVREVLE